MQDGTGSRCRSTSTPRASTSTPRTASSRRSRGRRRPLGRASSASCPAASTGRRSRWAVVAVWVVLALALAPLQGRAAGGGGRRERHVPGPRLGVGRGASDVDRRAFRRGTEMAAVIAYQRDGGITSEDRARIDADAEAICSSGGSRRSRWWARLRARLRRDDPLDLAPGPVLLTLRRQRVVLASALMPDDSTPTAEEAVARSAAIVPPPEGDATGLRAWVTGEAGFEADRSAAVKGDRRDAAAGHLRRAGAAAARDLPLAARGARAARGGRLAYSSPAASPTGSSRRGSRA